MKVVTIVDYGIGNLLSVSRAFEHCGAKVLQSKSPADVQNADYLVLPGVGAFADGMNELDTRRLIDPIKEFVRTERPFLGICLGMQMMLSESEEFGNHTGLGLIEGKVIQISNTGTDGAAYKVPHIGWNQLTAPVQGTVSHWRKTILGALPELASVYFVHSFTASPKDETDRLADSIYGGHRLSAVIRRGNSYGCQFHPEKSGSVGLSIIKNFLEL